MSEYLIDHERLRLRAERAETQATAWRATALILLVLLIAQTWLVVDTTIVLRDARQAAEQRLESVSVWHVAATNQTSNLLDCKEDEGRWINAARLVADRRDAEIDKRWAAEDKFRSCLSANGGLVESVIDLDQVTRQQREVIAEQQQLLRAAIDAAKRCDAGPGPALLEARNAW